MADNPIPDLARARILVTNDDGIHAPGLKVLEKVAKGLSKDVWVVAPETEQSGASHSLTLTEPLRVREQSRRRFAVRGTPTDCVLMALHEILADRPPDLVLSGINRGANLAEDVTYSGTIAAAMEGALLNVPSIALSQCLLAPHPPKWSTAEHHAPGVITKLVAAGWPPEVLMNVNFPDVPHARVTGVELCRQGRRDVKDLLIDSRVDPRGNAYHWIGFRRQEGRPRQGTDLAVTQRGAIAVTPLQLDLTDRRAMKALGAAFG